MFLLHAHGAEGESFLTEVLLHGLLECARLLPFLFITYLLMEYIEHRAARRAEGFIRSSRGFAPVLGGLLGVVPQCGFSAAAANLYSGEIITVGTLVAVFLSTSDEMLPILISGNFSAAAIFSILGYKAVCAIICGVALDLVLRKIKGKNGSAQEHSHEHHSHGKEHQNDFHQREAEYQNEGAEEIHAHLQDDAEARHENDSHGHHENDSHGHHENDSHGHHENDSHGHHENDSHEHHENDSHEHHENGAQEHRHGEEEHSSEKENFAEHSHDEEECHICHEGHGHCSKGVFASAIFHTLKTAGFVLFITLIINSAMFFIGEETLFAALPSIPLLSHLLAAIFGLIPNCAASVALTSLAASGIISSGEMLAGLFSGAGVGLAVLMRNKIERGKKILVLAVLVAVGTVFGLLADLIFPNILFW